MAKHKVNHSFQRLVSSWTRPVGEAVGDAGEPLRFHRAAGLPIAFDKPLRDGRGHIGVRRAVDYQHRWQRLGLAAVQHPLRAAPAHLFLIGKIGLGVRLEVRSVFLGIDVSLVRVQHPPH